LISWRVETLLCHFNSQILEVLYPLLVFWLFCAGNILHQVSTCQLVL
jgi:hypothetical protein